MECDSSSSNPLQFPLTLESLTIDANSETYQLVFIAMLNVPRLSRLNLTSLISLHAFDLSPLLRVLSLTGLALNIDGQLEDAADADMCEVVRQLTRCGLTELTINGAACNWSNGLANF